jgi:hypothetical protein
MTNEQVTQVGRILWDGQRKSPNGFYPGEPGDVLVVVPYWLTTHPYGEVRIAKRQIHCPKES